MAVTAELVLAFPQIALWPPQPNLRCPVDLTRITPGAISIRESRISTPSAPQPPALYPHPRGISPESGPRRDSPGPPHPHVLLADNPVIRRVETHPPEPREPALHPSMSCRCRNRPGQHRPPHTNSPIRSGTVNPMSAQSISSRVRSPGRRPSQTPECARLETPPMCCPARTEKPHTMCQ